MAPRTPRRLAAALATALVSLACAPAEQRPDVLLVTLDTTRADYVGVYGATHGATPHLDALARDGAWFTQAFAVAPLTLPSHASILTGQTPPRHGVRHNGIFRLTPEATTLAERLADVGFDTGAVVGAYVLAAEFGLAQGFAYYDDATAGAAAPGGFTERTASEVTEAALGWLRRSSGPRFLWAHYFDAHADYSPPSPYAERFAGDRYAGEIAYADAELGRLVEAARAAAGSRGLLVAVTADHGESLGEHGESTHAFSLYDASLRVPLVLSGPGVPAGVSISSVASIADVTPTLLALLDIEGPANADGVDLTRRLAEPAAPGDRAVYAETLATRFDFGWSELRSLRTAERRYVRAPRPELYDVTADPGELANLLTAGPGSAALHADDVAHLESLLAAYSGDEASPASAPLDDAGRSRLQALGYVLPAEPVATSGIDPKDGLRTLAEMDIPAAIRAFELGDVATAEPRLRAAARALPESARVRGKLGQLLLETGRADEARGELEAAARLAPASSGWWRLAGDAALRLDDPRHALACYERAYEGDPRDPFATAGLMLRALDRADEDPTRYAERAIELAPEDVAIRLRVAEGWEHLGRYDLALERAEEILDLDPETGAAHFLAAVQLVRMARFDAADEHLAHSGESGRDARSRNRLGIAFAAAGRSDRAEKIFRELAARHPDEASPRLNLARVLDRQGRSDEAQAVRATLQ